MAVRQAGSAPRIPFDPNLYLRASDEMLVEMFQAGDSLAFHALQERHASLLWRVVRQYFGASADIDDLVQDISIVLWQNKTAWKPEAARFSTWLYRVAANRCIDILRSRKQLSHDGTLLEQVQADTLSAHENLERLQLAQTLSDMLRELPQNQKQALELYYYEDVPVEDIARQLQVSELAARSLLKRGKQKLRAIAGQNLA